MIASLLVAVVMQSDRAYLSGVARDTWHCIADMVQTKTGLPYDNFDRHEWTSVSNIGLYLTSTVAAQQLGLVPKDEAELRCSKALENVGKLRTWHGFQQCWNSVDTLQAASHDTWVSVLDSGNLAAGLLTVAEAFPRLAKRSRSLFDAMDWRFFYDADQKALIGGFDTAKNEVNPKWHLSALGSDAAMAQFFAVATEGAPPQLWDTFDRGTETRDGHTYLRPGWQGGGLFMQYISGLWLDNRGNDLGKSAREFAAAQIAHAKSIGSPVWGWSASADPAGGYLGWGALKDEVVTPYASVLAIEDFPGEAAANLRALQTMGARSADSGFYDAVNVRTKEHTKGFLMLDQSMLLISLANYLRPGCIRHLFQSEPIVKRGRESIAIFR